MISNLIYHDKNLIAKDNRLLLQLPCI